LNDQGPQGYVLLVADRDLDAGMRIERGIVGPGAV
jgi:hypothetical protein